jgi:hypothetical protein
MSAIAATAIVEAIAATLATGDDEQAIVLIGTAKRDTLRSAFVRAGLGSSKDAKATKVGDLRNALNRANAEAGLAHAEANAEPAPKPEPKARKPRVSKYNALLTAIMAEHADDNGVAVVTASVLLEAGFAKSTTVYHADWHHSLPCGKACRDLNLVGRLSTKGDGENTVTITRVAV